jgi:hypothetical protein
MNWSLGFFRLWVLLSVGWVGLALLIAAGEPTNDWPRALLAVIGLPLALLMAGIALHWALRGFRT